MVKEINLLPGEDFVMVAGPALHADSSPVSRDDDNADAGQHGAMPY